MYEDAEEEVIDGRSPIEEIKEASFEGQGVGNQSGYDNDGQNNS